MHNVSRDDVNKINALRDHVNSLHNDIVWGVFFDWLLRTDFKLGATPSPLSKKFRKQWNIIRKAAEEIKRMGIAQRDANSGRWN